VSVGGAPGEPAARARALEAMVRIVAESGYEKATASAVTAQAGITRQQFESMFAGTYACFLEAYEAAVDVLHARVGKAYEDAAGLPWAERATAALRAFLETLAAEPGIARLALVDFASVGEDLSYRYRLAMERFTPMVEDGRAASPAGIDPPERTARFALGAATLQVAEEIREGRAAELPRILPDLVFTITMPYIGASAAEEAMRRAGETGGGAR
jgi:AcrR family transcriptional regulator